VIAVEPGGFPLAEHPAIDEAAVDRDLWAVLRWMMDGVGGAWSADKLDATGRLYKLSVAGS